MSAGTSRQSPSGGTKRCITTNPCLDIARAWARIGGLMALLAAAALNILPQPAAQQSVYMILGINAVPFILAAAYLLPAYRMMRLHEGRHRRHR